MHQSLYVFSRPLLVLLLAVVCGAPRAAQSQVIFGADESIMSVAPDGSDPAVLVEEQPEGLAVDAEGGFVYWSEDVYYEAIKRAKLDGSGVETIYDPTGPVSPQGIALDLSAEKLYFTDLMGDGAIRRMDLDGSNLETLVQDDNSTNGVLDVALDTEAGKMYWPIFGAIMRANLDGSAVETLVEFADYIQPTAIAVNARDRYVYWIDTSSDNIMRAPLDGGAAESLLSADSPAGLALDLANDKIYWMNDLIFSGAGRISRADLDGSNVEEVAETGIISGAIFVVAGGSGVAAESPEELPGEIDLAPNYPNPFNPSTTVRYTLPQAARVSLLVYNVIGQPVRTLVGGSLQQAGLHELSFDATGLPSGVYLLRLEAAGVARVRQMLLLK